MFRQVTPGTTSRLTTVDHGETYGRHVLAQVVPTLGSTPASTLAVGEDKICKWFWLSIPKLSALGLTMAIGMPLP
ncbi:hypothetical protein NC969_08745 [Leptolyngbya subtilissima ST-M1]|uniref:hypothetical protein n=1 Tax=Cyanophyceae TaxID=3028117 RepID=UPI0018EFD823|nr:hypothetical protein [Nodosilinea sp. FACHB-131]